MVLYEGRQLDISEASQTQIEKVHEAIEPLFDALPYPTQDSSWLFRLFKIFYQKVYDNALEEAQALKVFAANLEEMNRINLENLSFQVKINQFSDLEERNKPKGFKPPRFRDLINGETETLFYFSGNRCL